MLRLPLTSRTLIAAPRWARCKSTTPRTKDVEPSKTSEKVLASQVVPGRGLQVPYMHLRTHDIPVASIHFRSHHTRLLDLFTHFASHAASSLGIPTSGVAHLPTQRSLWTVIRSPFAHKKSQENFERKVHKRAIKAWDANPEVVERWIKYLRNHGMAGVGMRVTRWEHLPLGVGRKKYKNVVLEPKLVSSEDQIKALGEKILIEELSPHPRLTESNKV